MPVLSQYICGAHIISQYLYKPIASSFVFTSISVRKMNLISFRQEGYVLQECKKIALLHVSQTRHLTEM